MRNPLKRYNGRGDLHFLTFSCYRRASVSWDATSPRSICENLDQVRDRHGFRLMGCVVMPEHVHLLLSEAPQKNPSKTLQVLKQKAAKALLIRINAVRN